MTTATRRLRVTVTDAWDTVALDAAPDMTVEEVKHEALRRTLGAVRDPSMYEVKFRGALVLDEGARVADVDFPDGAPLIVLAARRRPVR